jgi:hypothetical protein
MNLFHLSMYLFAQWLYKESIPKATQTKAANKLKASALDDAADDEYQEEDEENNNDEEEGNENVDPLKSTHPTVNNDNDDDDDDDNMDVDPPPTIQSPPTNYLPQDRDMISRREIRMLLGSNGRVTHANFQPGHPQQLTHRLALNTSRHIPVLNGERTRSVETVRSLVASADAKDLSGADVEPQDEDQQQASTSTVRRPGDALRMKANEYALQILALHKPWDGNGDNLLNLEVPIMTTAASHTPPDDPIDDSDAVINEPATHVIRMDSYSECLLTWYDAKGSTAMPQHTREIMDHQENYHILKKLAKIMSISRRKDMREIIGLPALNESNRRAHGDDSSDSEEHSDSDEEADYNDYDSFYVDPNTIHGKPRELDKGMREMLDLMDLRTCTTTPCYENHAI